jgi:hypothetical protein
MYGFSKNKFLPLSYRLFSDAKFRKNPAFFTGPRSAGCEE